MHDAVIVGAGPGGSATAHFLSAAGLDVLLVDRAEFPRDKTCGDGLTPRALRELNAMGILGEVARQGCAVSAYEVVAPNGRATVAPIGDTPGGLVLPRMRLDHLILNRAVESGARFRPGVAVERVETTSRGARVVARQGETFAARVAVIASGAATGVLTRSRILDRQPQAMLAARAYFDGLQHKVQDRFQLRFDHAPTPGYGWVFPVSAHAANIGVVLMPKRRSDTTAEWFARFTRGLGPVLARAERVGPIKGYPIRVDFLTSPTHTEAALLVGEAAGLVNPLTGEGIDYALESGRLAANYLLPLFERGDFSAERLRGYHALLHARFASVFQFSAWVRDALCKPPLLNLLVPLANRQPDLRQLLAEVVLGERQLPHARPSTMAARLVAHIARRGFHTLKTSRAHD